MFKKTLIASALTASFVFAAHSVQAQNIPNLVTGLFDGFTNTQLEARRGGGTRRTSSVKRTTTKPRTTTSSSTTSTAKSNTSSSYAYPSTRTTTSSSALTPTTRSNTPTTTSTALTPTTSTTSSATRSTTSTTPANQYSGSNNNNQYGSQPYNSQYNNNQYGQYGSQYGNNQYGQYGSQYGQYSQPKQPSAALGMGATFVSSLAGAGAGVLLANMLLSPSAAAEQGTEIATPEMLADNQINELMPAVETQISDVENRLAAVGVDPSTGEVIESAAMTADSAMDKIALYEELLRLKDLEIKLLQEQVKRLEG